MLISHQANQSPAKGYAATLQPPYRSRQGCCKVLLPRYSSPPSPLLSRVGFLERPSLFRHQDAENGTYHARGVFPHHKAIQQKKPTLDSQPLSRVRAYP